MYQGVPVACRTRSKQGVVIGSGLSMGRKKRRVEEHDDDDEVICLGEKFEGESGALGKKNESGSGASSSSSGALKKRGFECLGEREDDPIHVVVISDSDIEAEEGSKKRFEDKEEGRSEEVGDGCSVFAHKVESFGTDECGGRPENPVILAPDSDGDSQIEEERDSLLSSIESEDEETSDEDFQVDGDNDDDNDDDDESECWSNEDSDDSSYDGERGGYNKTVRKMEIETESSGVWRRKGERKNNEQVEQEEEWNGADCASVTSTKSEIRKEETKKAEERHGAKRVESVNADVEVFVDHCQSSGCSMPSEDEALEDKKKGDRSHQSESLQKETGGSTMVKKSEKNNYANANTNDDGVDLDEHEGKEHHHDKGTSVGSVSSLPEREGKHDSVKDDSNGLEKEDDDVDQGQTQPLASRETVPLNWKFMKKEPIEKSDSEKDINMLWNELDMMLEVGENETGDSTVVKKSEKNNKANANANDCVGLDEHEGKEHHHGKGTVVRRVSSLSKNQEKIGVSAKVVIKEDKKGREHKDGFTECFGGKHDSVKDDSNGLEKEGDDVDQDQTQPLASRETVPLNWNFKKEEPIKKSESEKDISMLWNELDMMLQDGEIETGDSTVVKKGEKNNNANANDCMNLDEHGGKEHHNEKGTGVRRISSLPKSQEKIGISTKVVIKEDKKGRENKDGSNSNNRELHEVLRMPSRTKDRGFKFFTECFWGKHDSVKDDSNELDEKDDDVDQGQTRPIASREAIPLIWNFTKKEPIEKSESEKELDILWGELDMLLRAQEIGSQVDNVGTNEASENEESPTSHCKHDTILNEEIGIYCRLCGSVLTEIKYIDPPFVDSERSGRRVLSGSGVNTAEFDGALFNDSGDDSEAVWSHNGATVWDLIPDIKQNLYPHQQEGFEFIWTNLAGTTDLAKLKGVDSGSEGGCIISHAPGTGKTRLTMVFLQTYLQVFPKCLPVIIAPANILLTWEDELRKWKIGIPFHNLNNVELSGKEQAINEVDWSGNQQQNKGAIRMVKLCSWYKEKSILLISYNLYEKLAGGVDREKKKKNSKMKKEKKRARTRQYIESALGKVLRDYPGLLVLDEGHTPRNQRSCIWKVLSESRTQKRVLLSGTPFQNNFLELYNILCLMKPSFPDSIPQELKKFCQSRLMQERKASKDVSWEPVSSGNPADEKINQLKLLMNPFVHVHKGSILQKKLPGLRNCVLVLKPDSVQQKILESIESSQNGLNFEHKLALVSVHPSLFLNCSLSQKEESVVDKDQLEKLRLDPYEGVKTKFLKEFVTLCDAVNEKVLVFSQFIDTLSLIKDHLESAFNWSLGKEVLYMHGKLDQKQKQLLIHSFNDANSQAKVLLASIKACSEGINLIGASRVVLVDVVWNPSVERQAICRAYRLGQKRVVYTYHLLAQGTPECTKYRKQSEKDRLSELVFSNRNAENDKRKCCGEFEDIVLDLMVQHVNLKEMFAECLVQPKDRDLDILGS